MRKITLLFILLFLLACKSTKTITETNKTSIDSVFNKISVIDIVNLGDYDIEVHKIIYFKPYFDTIQKKTIQPVSEVVKTKIKAKTKQIQTSKDSVKIEVSKHSLFEKFESKKIDTQPTFLKWLFVPILISVIFLLVKVINKSKLIYKRL